MTSVSVIIPCFNEQDTIGLLLQAILNQTTPIDQIEIIVVDGMSTDQTRLKISGFQDSHPYLKIKVVDNPKRIIPAALNLGIAASSSEYIVRLDGHAIPYPDYIERCILSLKDGKGENVGGVWEIRPGGLENATWIARGIAAAAAHPLSVGDAHYRHTKRALYVDTVPFGAFRRSTVDRIGGFDESLLANEDYEFNVRIRKSGSKIWLDPAIRTIYIARSTYWQLAQQYWRYGFWKGQMLQRYPSTLRWRQALPPLFVSALVVLLLSAPWITLSRWMLLIIMAVYFSTLFSAAIFSSIVKKDWKLVITMPLATAIMHVCWGAGLNWSFLQAPFSRKKRE